MVSIIRSGTPPVSTPLPVILPLLLPSERKTHLEEIVVLWVLHDGCSTERSRKLKQVGDDE